MWALYIALAEGHPLAGGDLAKDVVVAALCKPFTSAKLAKDAAMTLVDELVDAITTHAFTAHTI
jgi:hypothetical protein